MDPRASYIEKTDVERDKESGRLLLLLLLLPRVRREASRHDSIRIQEVKCLTMAEQASRARRRPACPTASSHTPVATIGIDAKAQQPCVYSRQDGRSLGTLRMGGSKA